ncbi:kinase-like protein [Mollisia scopiformis]|uniref:non-specific serine/threonine protein kinase n=1 Tax=Mollisia scopiformis TaxID=149040 RepID=A0A194XSZ0_MOLSC|nr:kinase-like protein [Mollisia scopiformis]KUJ22847.1 kinase-like protein [Mollisia scopiformis]
MGQYFHDLLYTLTNCMSCFPGSPQLKINNRSFKILRLLGEGGFSYVYLVQDTGNEAQYALKKIRCPFGQESVAQALKEVEAYNLFSPNPNIIASVDHCVMADRSDPGAKTVYILLPYYRRGNLQDIINANLVNHTKFPEKRLMILFLGVCKALKAMHYYKVAGGPGGARSLQNARKIRGQAARADQDAEEEVEQRRGRQKGRELDPDSEQQEPLMDNEVTQSQEGVAPGEIRAYAHRDIKPGNIMIDDDGEQPILMDLGSLAPSPTPITSRSLALAVQDQAAEHSTMPYRAPELFDVKTGSTIDTKVDIWSLGCTLYACLVGKSPFEMRSDETGGSLSLCVLGGDWRFPDEGAGGKKKATNQPGQTEDSEIHESIREVVRKCLKVEAAERPDVNELIEIVEAVIAELPEDGHS